ncbi:MAG: hypothetical protein H6853_03595 [Rhodospirillales bacterium]|nr:hypothetical protein [Alphaproteobacteria bacterium]USO04366.1 MAG: hypothetical protein H6853_03595 [Rhodospirillales bacterium]
MLILEFTTQTEATNCLAAINGMAADYWSAQGFTVLDGSNGKELVGKKKGVDNLNAAHTLTWDQVKDSPEGTFYISSLSNEPRFAPALETLGMAFTFVEKEFPAAWEPAEPV